MRRNTNDSARPGWPEVRASQNRFVGHWTSPWGRKMAKCRHQKGRTRCRECGGGSYCEHDRLRGNCPMCSTEKIFQRYQRQAEQRNLNSFSLTLAQFESMVALPCVLCGEQPALGVDRKISSIGYVSNGAVQNCQPMCGVCNRWKSRTSMQTVLSHVEKICRYQEKLR